MKRQVWPLKGVLSLVWLLLPAFCTHAEAQQTPCNRVYFSALDHSDKAVTGLTSANFALHLGRRTVSLEGFRAPLRADDKTIPLVAWVLVDSNPNVNAAFIERQSVDAAAIFDLFHPDSLIGVKLVSDRLETLAPLGHDPAALRQAFAAFARKRTELSANSHVDTVPLRRGGLVKSIDYCIDELAAALAGQSRLREREVHRAIVILSDGNVDPAVKRAPIYHKAAEGRVFLYPVFVPRPRYGSWLEDYFELAWKTAGVPSVFGALAPGADVMRLSRPNTAANALTFNFMHVMRDLNGKYSFCLSNDAPQGSRITLKCKVKNVRVLLPSFE